MAFKKRSSTDDFGCRVALFLFDVGILACSVLPELKKEAVYQEAAMRMLSTMSFAPDPDDTAPNISELPTGGTPARSDLSEKPPGDTSAEGYLSPAW
jgi:hypothetical protein